MNLDFDLARWDTSRFSVDDVGDFVHRGVQLSFVIDDLVIEFWRFRNLMFRRCKPRCDLRLAVETSPFDAPLQNRHVRRMNEDHQRFRSDFFDPQCTLQIDPDNDMIAGRDRVSDLLFGNAVVVAENPGPLEQFIRLDSTLKLFNVQEVVVYAFTLPRTRVSSSGGNREVIVQSATGHAFDEHVFANARWARDHNDERIVFAGTDCVTAFSQRCRPTIAICPKTQGTKY